MTYKEQGRWQAHYGNNSLVDSGAALYVDSDEPDFDIGYYIGIFRRRRCLMAVVWAIVLVVAIIGTLLQKPRYGADATVLVQSSKPNVLGGIAAGVSFFPEIQSLMGSSSLETITALMSGEHFLDKVFK